MKKARQIHHCRRCGDEVSSVELAPYTDSICPVCRNIQLEAQEIHMQNHVNTRPVLTVIRPTITK